MFAKHFVKKSILKGVCKLIILHELQMRISSKQKQVERWNLSQPNPENKMRFDITFVGR
jgi:hypothetical protein